MSWLPLSAHGLVGLLVYPNGLDGEPCSFSSGLVLEFHTTSGLLEASLTHAEASSLLASLQSLLMSPLRINTLPGGFTASTDASVSPVRVRRPSYSLDVTGRTDTKPPNP